MTEVIAALKTCREPAKPQVKGEWIEPSQNSLWDFIEENLNEPKPAKKQTSPGRGGTVRPRAGVPVRRSAKPVDPVQTRMLALLTVGVVLCLITVAVFSLTGSDEDKQPPGPDSVAVDTGDKAKNPAAGTHPPMAVAPFTPEEARQHQERGAEYLGGTQADGWDSIFDGESLDGWEAYPRPECWSILEGAIRGQGGPSYLFYREPVGDFELWAEVMINRLGNSGIYFHASKEQKGPKGSSIVGQEVQIIGSALWAKGPMEFTGSYFGGTSVVENPIKDDEWFTLRLAVQEGAVKVWIDDQQVLDQKRNPTRSLGPGYLALQTWGGDTEVFFRRIALRQSGTDKL